MAHRRQLRSPRFWWALLLVGAMAGGAGGQGPARIEIQFEALQPKLEVGKPPERLQLRIGG